MTATIWDGNSSYDDRIRLLLEQVLGFLIADGEVLISVSRDEAAVSYMIQVAPEDLGKVVGEQGKTAQAIRTIVKACARRNGQIAHVEIRAVLAG